MDGTGEGGGMGTAHPHFRASARWGHGAVCPRLGTDPGQELQGRARRAGREDQKGGRCARSEKSVV